MSDFGGGGCIIVERQAREENQALRQQIAGLAADNQSLSNRLQQQAAGPSALPGEQFRELLRLRGEVGMLRQQTNALGKVREENNRLQTNDDESARVKLADYLARVKGLETRTVNAAKIIGVAARIWANDNNNLYPTNFELMSNELAGAIPKDCPQTDSFELLNVGRASDKWPRAVFARERVARPMPDGGWARAYLLCDGSVQLAKSADGNFEAWEQQNTDAIPTPGP